MESINNSETNADLVSASDMDNNTSNMINNIKTPIKTTIEDKFTLMAKPVNKKEYTHQHKSLYGSDSDLQSAEWSI